MGLGVSADVRRAVLQLLGPQIPTGLLGTGASLSSHVLAVPAVLLPSVPSTHDGCPASVNSRIVLSRNVPPSEPRTTQIAFNGADAIVLSVTSARRMRKRRMPHQTRRVQSSCPSPRPRP